MRQRRALIMADGQRSLAELTTLLGVETPQHVADLIQAGYLSPDPEPTLYEPHLTDDLPALAPACAPPSPASKIDGRWSMVAARLYLLGVLEQQRDPLAQQLHQQLHRTLEDSDAVQVMLAALAALPQIASSGQRVHDRLAEVLPEAHLHALTRT